MLIRGKELRNLYQELIAVFDDSVDALEAFLRGAAAAAAVLFSSLVVVARDSLEPFKPFAPAFVIGCWKARDARWLAAKLPVGGAMTSLADMVMSART